LPYAAIAATLALGTVAVEPERVADGSVHIWLDPGVLAKLKALRGPGESYSDFIPQLARRSRPDSSLSRHRVALLDRSPRAQSIF
jgi:hypothetical protein